MYRIPLYIIGKYSNIPYRLYTAINNILNNMIEKDHTSRLERKVVSVLFCLEHIPNMHYLALVQYENKVLARHNMY